MLKDYFLLFKKGGINFRDNMVLYIPYLLEVFIGCILLLLIVGAEGGAFYLLLGSLKDIKAKILSNNIALILLIVFVLLDIFAFVLISSFFRAMKIGMYKEVMTEKKTGTDFMFFYAKKFFRKKFEVSLIVLLVFLLPLLLLAVIAGFFFVVSKGIGVIMAAILGAIYVIYFVIAGIIVSFGLFFIDPIIVSQEKSPVELITQSLGFARKNISKLVITWAVVFMFGLVINLILYILELPFNLLKLPPYVLFISIFLFVARFIVQTGVNIIEDLFVFNVYFRSK